MGADDVSLKITPGKTISGDKAESDVPVLVSVVPHSESGRAPTDLCVVLDISWSMSMEATITNASGVEERNGLSLIDIAKHGMRTVIQALGDQDRCSLVTFCRDAKEVMPLTKMDDAGKRMADDAITAIGFGEATKMWQGLDRGLESLGGSAKDGRISHMILLTDGVAQDKDDVMPNLRAFKSKNERLPCTISVFGFGYEIDSDLLEKVADFSNGTYAFIPDAGFVGTIFVNAMANLLTTTAIYASLTLEAEEGAKIEGVLGGWVAEDVGSAGKRVDLGIIQCGQTKDVMLRMSTAASKESFLVAAIQYTPAGAAPTDLKSSNCEAAPGGKVDCDLVESHRCRCLFVDALVKAIAACHTGNNSDSSIMEASSVIKQVASEIKSSSAIEDKFVKALLEDVEGQAAEAVSKPDWYKKWGHHYLRSIMFAHRLQQCNNFKDPGVQYYGGDLFNEIRDMADDCFNKLSAPVPTPCMYRYIGNGRLIQNPEFEQPRRSGGYTPAPVNMSAYNNAAGVCIDGACHLTLSTGVEKRISEVVKGDQVLGADGSPAEVECVVRTRLPTAAAMLVDLPGGARLTPYHPVQIEGKWCFPVDLAPALEHPCEAVYSFVLRESPALLVNGVPCAALGHGMDDFVAKHPYFGTQRVLQDLREISGYDSGLVDLMYGSAVRDAETGLVCGLRAHQQTRGGA